MMTGGRGTGMVGYNVQASVDAEHHLIVDHEVTNTGLDNGQLGGMARAICERLTAGKHTPERCLEAAFRFMLDREPKESILSRFDVIVISRYFSEFERELPHYLLRP